MEIVRIIVNVVFVISAILLILVVLMQEGKGGGLGASFGGAGGEAFGHGVGGINRFTGILAGVLIACAITLAFMNNGNPIN